MKKHPNRIPFEGVLTRIDQPSDKAPSGAKGHRVILTRAAAEEALDSLLGMAVGFKADWDGHDARQKCGIINEAWIESDAIYVKGYIFGRDFPEVCPALEKAETDAPLGMSYEMADAHVADMGAAVWVLTSVTFTGAAILLRDKAAYRSTTVSLSAAAEPFTGKIVLEGGIELTVGPKGKLFLLRCNEEAN